MKKSMLMMFLLIILMLVPAAFLTGGFKGKVIDKDSGKGISGAIVSIPALGQKAVTDLSGEFYFANLPDGTYDLEISCKGYKTLKYEGIVITSGMLNKSFSMVKSSKQLKKPEAETLNPLIEDNKMNMAFSRSGEAQSSGYYKDGFTTEEYTRIYDNDYKLVKTDPLSTFSIDVDAASYTNVRRYLEGGSLPPKDAIRTEEMVNFFTYNYPQPENNLPFSITTEYSTAPWNSKHKLLMIGVQGKKIPIEKLPPSNLVFLIDVSGSMEDENKLPLVKASMKLLVQQLRKNDKVAIVVYAGNAGLALPSTSGENKKEIINTIDNLEAGGSTAGGEGILLAYKIAKENFIKGGNNRIILATDGDFNVGISSTGDLVRLIEEKQNDGIFLTALGFGMGNYKDSRLEQLADKGNGNYAYIDNFNEAKRMLVGQMEGTLFTIAKDVKIQIEFNPEYVQGYRLIGYENRLLSATDFNDDKKDAGELGSGHTVTALYEIIPVGVNSDLPDVDDLKYQQPKIKTNSSESDEILTLKLRYKEPEGDKSKLITKTVFNKTQAFSETSSDFRFASSVAEFAMLLRDSPYKADSNFASLISRAENSLDKDPEGYRAEFVRLVKIARDLMAVFN